MGTSTFNPGMMLTPLAGFDPGTNRFYNENEDGYSHYERNAHLWTEALYEEAKYEQSQDPEFNLMGKHLKYFMGDQWPSGRPAYKSRATLNRTTRLMMELVSLLTDIRPIMAIGSKNDKYKDQAEMTDEAIRSWWYEYDADLSFSMMIIYGLFGTGYGKLAWNEDLAGGQGDLELTPLGMDEVKVFRARHTIDSAQAVIYETPQPLGWFRKRYPTRGRLVKPDIRLSSYQPSQQQRGPVMIGTRLDQLSPSIKRMMGVGKTQQSFVQSTSPMATYREFWIMDWTYNDSGNDVIMPLDRPKENWAYTVRPGGMLYPRLRLIIKGGDTILYDGPSPYWHGKYPFVPVRLNPVPWQFGGISEFRSLVQQQDVINNIVAGLIDMVKKILNPGVHGPKSSLSDAAWNSFDPAMPGRKLAWNMSGGEVKEFTQPSVPAYVLSLLNLVMREQDSGSVGAGVSDAANKKQVPSMGGLDLIRQTRTTGVRLKGRNLEASLRGLGRLAVPDILQFYSLKRRILKFGDKGITAQDYDLDPGSVVPVTISPQDHMANFIFNIEQGTLLNLDRIEKAVMLSRLRQMGEIGRKQLFEGLDLRWSTDEVEKELKRERDEGVPLMVPPGRGGATSTRSASAV